MWQKRDLLSLLGESQACTLRASEVMTLNEPRVCMQSAVSGHVQKFERSWLNLFAKFLTV